MLEHPRASLVHTEYNMVPVAAARMAAWYTRRLLLAPVGALTVVDILASFRARSPLSAGWSSAAPLRGGSREVGILLGAGTGCFTIFHLTVVHRQVLEIGTKDAGPAYT